MNWGCCFHQPQIVKSWSGIIHRALDFQASFQNLSSHAYCFVLIFLDLKFLVFPKAVLVESYQRCPDSLARAMFRTISNTCGAILLNLPFIKYFPGFLSLFLVSRKFIKCCYDSISYNWKIWILIKIIIINACKIWKFIFFFNKYKAYQKENFLELHDHLKF